MELSAEVKSEIDRLVASKDVVLFMKGRRTMPQCGFSATVVQILNEVADDYATVNVLTEPDIRDGIKTYSSWPTIPQLYIKGEFVGGCDIVKDLHNQGKLAEMLGKTPEPIEMPKIELTASAVAALDGAREGDEPKIIRFEVSPDFRYALSFDPRVAKGDFEVATGEYTLNVDPTSARRAQQVTIDFVEAPGGGGFKIENPAAPSR